MSVDNGFLPPSVFGAEEHVGFWHDRSEPGRAIFENQTTSLNGRFPSASGTAFTTGAARDSWRDSEFYRFYDEVLAEYAS